MRTLFRRRPSPALLVSMIALVVASAGGASALQGSAARAPRFVVGAHSAKGHVPKGGAGTVDVRCPSSGAFAGTRAVSGGYVTDSGFVYATESRIILPNDYQVTLTYPPTLNNESGADFTATVYCGKVK